MLDKFIDDKLYPFIKKLEVKLSRHKKDKARKYATDLLNHNCKVRDKVEALGFDISTQFLVIDGQIMTMLGEIEKHGKRRSIRE
jgi:hypothetical protein